MLSDLPWGRLGLTVCYDLRFPALYRALAEAGASFLAIPAAFTQQTGEAHWHILNRARAIEVIKLPEQAVPNHAPRGKFSPSVIEGDLGRVRPSPANDAPPYVSIPVMGRIAAGTPIEAIQSRSHTIGMPPDMLGTGDHYALEVRGDSMIEAGIHDGDTVIIKKQDSANTGDIIVALIDDEEATLKRLRKRGSSIALEAANPAYETRVLGPDRVRIQGKLVSLMRRY